VGGLNSGSRLRSGKLTDEQLHRLSIQQVRYAFGASAFDERVRSLAPHRAGVAVRVDEEGAYAFRVMRDEGPDTIAYGLAEAFAADSPRQFICLAESSPRYGGTRYWFRCPRSSCGGRCAVLYREPRSNARAFACRKCIRFRYATQVLGDADLILRRAEKLLGRCQLQPDGSIHRRKGMHHRTFSRLAADLETHAANWRTTSPLARHFERGLADIERQLATVGL
jgi:hypothetical protein